MKDFVKKIILFLFPLFFIVITMEPLLRNIPNEFKYKNNYLDRNSNEITKLFLGSSHTYYGIDPRVIGGNSFNAGHVNQSIDLDFEILKKYSNNWGMLKYIMIPIDYPSLFVSKSSRPGLIWMMKYYNLYYDMDLSNSLFENSEILTPSFRSSINRIFTYYILGDEIGTWSELGFGHVDSYIIDSDLSLSGEKAALRHTISDQTSLNYNISIINELIVFAKTKNINILFYTSPACNTYVSKLNKNQLDLTINTISKIANDNSNCTYINLLKDNHFSSSDFRDANHLNQNGAEKFSIMIDKIINNLSSYKLIAEK